MGPIIALFAYICCQWCSEGAKAIPSWRIEERRDEIAHGVFVTTYVALDQYGFWRGDYVTWEGANARVRQGNLQIKIQRDAYAVSKLSNASHSSDRAADGDAPGLIVQSGRVSD
jgi:hypothetical protein